MRRVQLVTLAVVVAAMGCAWAPGRGEAAMVKLGVGQLAAGADTIVLGTVTGQTSAWNAGRTAIYTDVTVAVETAVKGTPGAEVTLRIAGGEVEGIGMRTSTDPVFQTGERVVVFIDTAGAATAQLVGMRQGKFTVRNNQVSVEGRATQVADFLNQIRVLSR